MATARKTSKSGSRSTGTGRNTSSRASAKRGVARASGGSQRSNSKGRGKSGPQVSGRWTDLEVDALRELASHNTPTRVMGIKLGRSESSIYAKASSIGMSLKPSNRSPYG